MLNILCCFFLSLSLAACSPFAWKVAEDILEGELKVVEKVFEDVGAVNCVKGVTLCSVQF